MTLVFSFTSVALEIVLGVAIALVMNQQFKGRGILRALIIIPWALPSIVNASMWSWILNANYGALNGLLSQLGIIIQVLGADVFGRTHETGTCPSETHQPPSTVSSTPVTNLDAGSHR